MNALELIAYTQRIISDQGMQVWGGEEAILDHLDTAYQKVHGRLGNFDIGVGEVSKDYAWSAPASGKTESAYQLPRYFEQVKLVELLDSSGNPISTRAWPMDQIQARYPGNAGYCGFLWWMRNHRLTIDTQWASGFTAPATVRVWFYREPPGLVVFQPETDASDGTTINFPTEPLNSMGKMMRIDGWYDSTVWEIVTGPGQGQIFEIDSYVGSTGVGTIATAETLSPIATQGSVIASVPAIPGRAHALIAYETAIDGARIEENTNAASLLEMERKERWKDLNDTLSVRQVQMTRNFIDTGFE